MLGLLELLGCDVMTDCIRRVISCVCCIACAGPIMAIIGLVFLVAPNDRKENVDKYNSAVRTYEGGDMLAIKASTGLAGPNATAATTALSLASSAVEVKGSTDGVDPATSWALQAAQVRAAGFGTGGQRTVTLKLQHGAAGALATLDVAAPGSRSSTASLYCTATSQAMCSESTLRSKCSSAHGGTGTPRCDTTRRDRSSGRHTSSSSQWRYTCNMACAYREYLSKMCVPVAFNAATKTWAKSVDLDSCSAPFASRDQTYGSSERLDIAVTVMSEEDPNIQLEKIAGKDRSFGISAVQQRGVGAALLGVGIAMIVFVYGGIALAIYCIVQSRRRDEGSVKNPDHYPQPDMVPGHVQPGYPQQPGYPPQQPGYPMQQMGLAPPPQQQQQYPQQYAQQPPQQQQSSGPFDMFSRITR